MASRLNLKGQVGINQVERASWAKEIAQVKSKAWNRLVIQELPTISSDHKIE